MPARTTRRQDPFPPDISRLLTRFAAELAETIDLVGLYVYGSLMTGDFSPARSDIDVVAVTKSELDKAALDRVRRLHDRLTQLDRPDHGGRSDSGGAAQKLHCLYVPAGLLGDPDHLHPYWYGDRLTQWQLKVITQAELAAHGRALRGEWPVPGLPSVAVTDLQAAIRAELCGYWRRMAARRGVWLRDTWVDLGLITLPRAAAVLDTGELITKGEAIGELGQFSVPAALVAQIHRRRAGEQVRLNWLQRSIRAGRVRRIMSTSLRRLTSADGSANTSGH